MTTAALSISIFQPLDTHRSAFLLSKLYQSFVELLGKLLIVPLDDIAPTDLVHDAVPVSCKMFLVWTTIDMHKNRNSD